MEEKKKISKWIFGLSVILAGVSFGIAGLILTDSLILPVDEMMILFTLFLIPLIVILCSVGEL